MLALADVAVVVSDARASAEWWAKNLGFTSHTVGGSGHALLVGPPGDRYVIHLCEGFAPLEPGDTGIAFVTDEIGPLVARMRAGSVRFPEPLKKERWGSMAKFSDPDGNIFWLLEAPTALVRATLRTRAPTTVRRPPPERARPRPRSTSGRAKPKRGRRKRRRT